MISGKIHESRPSYNNILFTVSPRSGYLSKPLLYGLQYSANHCDYPEHIPKIDDNVQEAQMGL